MCAFCVRHCHLLSKWRPHRESNSDQRFRKPLFYPLNYGDGVRRRPTCQTPSAASSPESALSTHHFKKRARQSLAAPGKIPDLEI